VQDWGTTPAVIDTALTFADENDIAITIHTVGGDRILIWVF
jgi:urease alpha subunit